MATMTTEQTKELAALRQGGQMKPATPLPYKTSSGGPVYGSDGSVMAVNTACVASRSRIVATVVNRRDSTICAQQDAIYIAHCCNAYPRLVEALRAYVDRAHGRDIPQDVAAAALLRDLGEEQ